MSTRLTKRNASSTSTRYARSGTGKTGKTSSTRGESPMAYGPAEVVSRPSNSSIKKVYESEAFRSAVANDIRHHVARNLLYLRRYRGISQAALAAAVGTSQPAIARIESAQENITLDTLRRLTDALNGRFSVSIAPAEIAHPRQNWWEELSDAGTANDWRVGGHVTWLRGSAGDARTTTAPVTSAVPSLPPASTFS